MPVSVRNLMAAVNAAQKAIHIARNEFETEGNRCKALLGAANQLCRQFKSFYDDNDYWNALKGRKHHQDAQSLNRFLSGLAANRNQHLDDLAMLFRLCGYEPPEHSPEVVRGLVSSLHAASMIGVGGISVTHVGRSNSAILSTARASLETFAKQFCSAHRHLSRILKRSDRSGKTKKAATAVLLKLVTWGASVMVVAVLGAAAAPMAKEHLPPEARQFVCEREYLVPEIIKPLVKEALCVLPNDVIDGGRGDDGVSKLNTSVVGVGEARRRADVERDEIARARAQHMKEVLAEHAKKFGDRYRLP